MTWDNLRGAIRAAAVAAERNASLYHGRRGHATGSRKVGAHYVGFVVCWDREWGVTYTAAWAHGFASKREALSWARGVGTPGRHDVSSQR